MPDNLQTAVRRIATHKLSTGKTVELYALSLSDYVAAREESLRRYRRERLEAWTQNYDLLDALGEDEKQKLLRDAFDRAERLTLVDLPKMSMRLPMRQKNGMVQRDKAGNIVTQVQKVEYAAWWMSETVEGRLFMTWLSMKHGDSSMTLEDAEQIYTDAMHELETVADMVGDISTPELGNLQPPTGREAMTGAKQRRKRRRTGR